MTGQKQQLKHSCEITLFFPELPIALQLKQILLSSVYGLPVNIDEIHSIVNYACNWVINCCNQHVKNLDKKKDCSIPWASMEMFADKEVGIFIWIETYMPNLDMSPKGGS